MKMTLFVDSSHCPKTGAGGWCSWAKKDGWKFGAYDGNQIRLKDFAICQSGTAEIAGIGYALWHHHVQGDLADVQVLMIQCDSVQALGYILALVPKCKVSAVKGMESPFIARAKPGKTPPVVKTICKTIFDVTQHIPTIFVRHVKGHSNKDDGRSHVNDRCDRTAKLHMSMMRRELMNEGEIISK